MLGWKYKLGYRLGKLAPIAIPKRLKRTRFQWHIPSFHLPQVTPPPPTHTHVGVHVGGVGWGGVVA